MYSRNVQDQELTFTFDPHKYLDNLMLMDTETGSVWSQLDLRAVDGRLQGAQLQLLPTVQTTWKHWRSMFPNTQVIDLSSGDNAVLSQRFVQHIAARGDGVDQEDTDAAGPVKPSEQVLGITRQATSKAYPFSRLAEQARLFLRDSLENQTVLIHFDREANAAWATDEAGQLLPAITTLWHIWQSFHPDTAAWGVDPVLTESAAAHAPGGQPGKQTSADSGDQTPSE